MSGISTLDVEAPGASKRVCSACHQRKVACDRRRPSFSFCQKHNFECEYSSTDRKSGLCAGFVSQLEQRLVGLEARVVKELGRNDHTRNDPMDVGNTYMISRDDAEIYDGAAALSAFAASSSSAVPSTPPAETTPIAASSPPEPAILSVETTAQLHNYKLII